MKEKKPSRLRFNFGFLLESPLGTSRRVELNYPTIRVSDDVTLSPLKGEFQATRTSEGIYLTGKLNSVITVECVRCLEDAHLPIAIELDDLFYHPIHTTPYGEYGIDEDGILDLAPLVRELSLLAVPIQAVCKADCRGLCDQCGQNLNEGTCDCKKDDIDPRMAALKELLN